MQRIITLFLLVSCFSCVQKTNEKQLILQYNNSFKIVNGVLLYKEKSFTGTVLSHDIINKTDNSVQYKNGKKHGIARKYYVNKQLAEERFYTKGNKAGVHKAWWNNGKPKFEYHFNSNGEYEGEVKEWYKNGQPLKIFHFKKGKEEGSQKMWQSDGKIRANFVTKKGERFGLIGLKKCYSVNTKNEVIQ